MQRSRAQPDAQRRSLDPPPDLHPERHEREDQPEQDNQPEHNHHKPEQNVKQRHKHV